MDVGGDRNEAGGAGEEPTTAGNTGAIRPLILTPEVVAAGPGTDGNRLPLDQEWRIAEAPLDPLAAALAEAMRLRGRDIALAALRTGLPLPKDGRLTPELALLAAQAQDFRAMITRRGALADLPEAVLPAILFLKGRDACVLAAGGTRINPARPEGIATRDAMFRMDGHAAFRVTGRRLPRFLKRLLAAAAVEREQIDVVIPHQASAQALAHACEILGFAANQVIDIFATHGNQIAASLPTALHHAITGGRLRRGDTALLLGSSAGISLGGAVLRF